MVDLRLVSIADAEVRGIDAIRQDRATYDLMPGDPRATLLTRAVVFGAYCPRQPNSVQKLFKFH